MLSFHILIHRLLPFVSEGVLKPNIVTLIAAEDSDGGGDVNDDDGEVQTV